MVLYRVVSTVPDSPGLIRIIKASVAGRSFSVVGAGPEVGLNCYIGYIIENLSHVTDNFLVESIPHHC